MPDLTVSSNVDSLMSAADYAAMRALLGLREVLTAARTYYVRTDGSDSNNGLANTAGGAFLTWANALSVVALLDGGGFAVTIKGTGTFTTGLNINQRFVGLPSLTIDGDTTTPANCIIAPTSGVAILVDTNSTKVNIQGLRLGNGTGTDQGVGVLSGLVDLTGLCEFGQVTNFHWLVTSYTGEANISANYTILGDCQIHWAAFDGGFIRCNSSPVTITASGSRAATSAWLIADRRGAILLVNLTWSGTFTGPQFTVGALSMITRVSVTGTPGSTAGSTNALGVYN